MPMSVEYIPFRLFGNGKFQLVKKSTLSFHPSFFEMSSELIEVNI